MNAFLNNVGKLDWLINDLKIIVNGSTISEHPHEAPKLELKKDRVVYERWVS